MQKLRDRQAVKQKAQTPKKISKKCFSVEHFYFILTEEVSIYFLAQFFNPKEMLQ